MTDTVSNSTGNTGGINGLADAVGKLCADYGIKAWMFNCVADTDLDTLASSDRVHYFSTINNTKNITTTQKKDYLSRVVTQYSENLSGL